MRIETIEREKSSVSFTQFFANAVVREAALRLLNRLLEQSDLAFIAAGRLGLLDPEKECFADVRSALQERREWLMSLRDELAFGEHVDTDRVLAQVPEWFAAALRLELNVIARALIDGKNAQ